MVVSMAPGFPLLWTALLLLAGGCVVTDFKAHSSFSLNWPVCRALSEVLHRDCRT